MTTRTAPQLTDRDRSIITRARRLADAKADSLRALAGADAEIPDELIRGEALGVAQYLLGELADLAERLGGGNG